MLVTQVWWVEDRWRGRWIVLGAVMKVSVCYHMVSIRCMEGLRFEMD